MIGVVVFNGGGIGATLINGDLVGFTVQCDGLFQEAPRGSLIALGSEQEVDRIAIASNGPVEILPLTVDLDVGLVHAPARAQWPLAPAKHGGQHRHDLDCPAMYRRVVDDHAAFLHHLFEVAKAQRIRHIPAHAREHHFQRIAHPLDHRAQRCDHRLHLVVKISGQLTKYALIATESKILTLADLR
jgi:hypothetical protein